MKSEEKWLKLGKVGKSEKKVEKSGKKAVKSGEKWLKVAKSG